MSMVDPSIDYLTKKVDSKYTLVILAAKRARSLTKKAQPESGADKVVATPDKSLNRDKEVSIALKEIAKDIITYERDKNI